jgi:hypothetical protein
MAEQEAKPKKKKPMVKKEGYTCMGCDAPYGCRLWALDPELEKANPTPVAKLKHGGLLCIRCTVAEQGVDMQNINVVNGWLYTQGDGKQAPWRATRNIRNRVPRYPPDGTDMPGAHIMKALSLFPKRIEPEAEPVLS